MEFTVSITYPFKVNKIPQKPKKKKLSCWINLPYDLDSSDYLFILFLYYPEPE